MRFIIPEQFQHHLGSMDGLLGKFILPRRHERIKEVLENRSRKVICVFDHTHHMHNVSAVLRSLEAFGFMDAYFIHTNLNMPFRQNDSVDRGSSQWLFPRHIGAPDDFFSSLKQQKYQIALVSLPSFSSTGSIYNVQKTSFSSANLSHDDSFLELFKENHLCLVFGNELNGIDEAFHKYASFYLNIPMSGFVESLNLSVCAGILLHELRRIMTHHHISYPLLDQEKRLLLDDWLLRTVSCSQSVLKQNRELKDYSQFLMKRSYLVF